MGMTCYDCVYLGRRCIGRAEVPCEHPDKRTEKRGSEDKPTSYKTHTVTVETPACDKAFFSHKARQTVALEEIRERLYRT